MLELVLRHSLSVHELVSHQVRLPYLGWDFELFNNTCNAYCEVWDKPGNGDFDINGTGDFHL